MSESLIQVLPKALCDQLAAGEVLERASSAIKELAENSLDAESDEIFIEVEEAGRKLLSVSDNGKGMSPDDAKLSILRHATSKIHSTDDLSAILTMGFRGEALASMAAVTRLSMTTRERGGAVGTFLRAEGSEIVEFRECAAAQGTQIVLEDLFFNTPARLKFLKTAETENRKICDVIEKFALACPEVHWKLTVDGRVKCDYPKHRSLRERALAVFGRALYAHLFPIQSTRLGDISVDGLFCSPDYIQSKSGRYYTFVNRRIVEDRTMNSAISKAYDEFLHGRKTCVVLFVALPPDQIDVNVHPTKHEIRFVSPDAVFRAIYRALRASLEKTPWIASGADGAADLPDSVYMSPEEIVRRAMRLPDADRVEKALADRAARHDFSDDPSCVPTGGDGLWGIQSDEAGRAARELSMFDVPPAPLAPSEAAREFSGFAAPRQRMLGIPAPDAPQTETPEALQFGYFSRLRYIGQHDLTYLLCSDGRDLIVIDQHAAHERINFERLKRVADELLPPDAQLLMFPILLDLDSRLMSVLEEYRDFFEKLGFQFDEIGKNSYAIRAVPGCLTDYDCAALIRDALIDLGETGRADQFDDIRDTILATMACHQSIRAGFKMTPADVAELFRQMDETGFRSNCPHGRPVSFSLSHAELEKRFLRTGFAPHKGQGRT